jgi:hypothetical protein
MFFSPMIHCCAGHIGKPAKKPAALRISTARILQKNRPCQRQGLIQRRSIAVAWCQRPKNSHNRMITGIGTPSSQSKIPRPMFLSSNFSIKGKTPRGAPGSGDRNRKRPRQGPVFDTTRRENQREDCVADFSVILSLLARRARPVD